MIRGKIDKANFELRYDGGRFSGRYESNEAKQLIEEMEMYTYHPIKVVGVYKITDDEIIGWLMLDRMSKDSKLIKLLSPLPAFSPEINDADSAEEDEA